MMADMGKNTSKTEQKPEFEVIDRRPFANLEAVPAGAPADVKPRYPTYVEELQARVAEVERRFAEKKAEMQQEIARTKTRLEADFERRVGLEKQKILSPLLEVLDNLERALGASADSVSCNSLREGIRVTASLFQQRLASLGVEPIAALHRPFNPDEHEAVTCVDVSTPELDGLVIDEVIRGYRVDGHILRAAQVRVGRFQPPTAD